MEPARATPGGRLAMMMQAAENDGRARRWSIDVMRTVSRCCDARHGRQRFPKGGRSERRADCLKLQYAISTQEILVTQRRLLSNSFTISEVDNRGSV